MRGGNGGQGAEPVFSDRGRPEAPPSGCCLETAAGPVSAETTMSLRGIAKRLRIATASSLANLLRREEKKQQYVEVRDPFMIQKRKWIFGPLLVVPPCLIIFSIVSGSAELRQPPPPPPPEQNQTMDA